MSARYSFGDFELDPDNRTLVRLGIPVELSGRYFDALVLLIALRGRLVAKDRFLAEVWRGIPVTDEALTQCVRSLRNALGDDAARPQYIQTVPKHGYRFIADVLEVAEGAHLSTIRLISDRRRSALVALAGTVGGGLAGLAGGLIYGMFVASQSTPHHLGGLSILLVVSCISTAVALLGAAGVNIGLHVGERWSHRSPFLAAVGGGATGGFVVGLVAKLILLDAFRFLIGNSPDRVTGALEGMILGGAVGLTVWAASPNRAVRTGALLGGSCGAVAGFLIALLNRPLLAGSLLILATGSPNARQSLDALGELVGENGFGSLARFAATIFEGAIFAAAIMVARQIAARQYDDVR